jgi:hypothetical protein
MMASAFYTIITPVLNPLIYSLHNKDVRRTLSSAIQSRMSPRKVASGKVWE